MLANATIGTSAPWRGAITIPGTGTPGGALLRDLLALALCPNPETAMSVVIAARLPDGTDRAAFVVASPRAGASSVVGSDFTSHGEHVDVRVEYTEPSRGDINSALRSTTASPVTAIAIVIR